MRTLGFLGILALIPLNILGLISAVRNRDYKALALMLFFAALLTFFAVTLWRGRQFERNQAQHASLVEGWGGEPVSVFFVQVVLNSPEGIICLAGALASVAAAVVCLLWPAAVGVSAAQASMNATLFGLWPFVLLVWSVKACTDTWLPRIERVAMALAWVALPFYAAYLRSTA